MVGGWSACSGGVGGTSDSGGRTPVDVQGACGVICEGGALGCVIEGFDPADGLEACVRDCRAAWAWEQQQACVSQADFVLECVEANGSCGSLDVATCGTAKDELVDCATVNRKLP